MVFTVIGKNKGENLSLLSSAGRATDL